MEKGPVFGLSIGELLTIYDHDSRSWKMSECLFTGDYAKYSEALPKSGIMRNGRIYAQATWARRTGGKESGLWRTPNAGDGEHGGPNARDSGGALHLTAQVARFPTPQVFDATCGDLKGKEYNGETRHAMKLIQAVKRFPTPHSNCHTGPGKRGENLQTAVMWPTPQSRDWKGKSQRGADPENRDCLPNAVMNYPTPVASGKLNGGTRDFQILQNLADCGQITEDERRSMSAGNGGQLNPQFVEWLMGYPLNYTDTRDDLRLSLIRE